MKDRMIDFTKLFGHASGMFHQDDWYVENTEPQSSDHYRPAEVVEEMMSELICQGCLVRAQGSG
jgi:hypothetical protein